MAATLAQMTALMLLGTVWSFFKPAGLTAQQTRLVLTQLVYYLLLPALVLSALWTAKIGQQTLEIVLICSSGIVISLALLWGILGQFKLGNSQTGALMLAIFPNVTFLGLPVLEKTFGEFGRSVVIQFDLFGFEPWLFTLGIATAQHYSASEEKNASIWLSLFKIPAIWAAVVAVICNFNHFAMPSVLNGILSTLAAAVVPLMLLSLGMGLAWESLHWRNFPKVLPVLVIKLAVMPLLALFVALRLDISGDFLTASILEMAMPSMMFGIVLCDRYQLDSGLYAMTVTVTTLLSLISIPLWYHALIGDVFNLLF
jgi:malate permease and related proteins